VFASPTPQSANFTTFLQTMAQLTQRPLASLSSRWRRLNQTLVVEPRTAPPNESAVGAGGGMVRIPAAASWRFLVRDGLPR
jgi:hypothetical protein